MGANFILGFIAGAAAYRIFHRIVIEFKRLARKKLKKAEKEAERKEKSQLRRGSCLQYVRKGRRYKIEEVLPLIKGKEGKGNHRYIWLNDDKVKVSSQRLLTFVRSGVKCQRCGIEGIFFIKERHRKGDTKRFHLNLYAFNEHGSEILMTSDHIMPKAHGGSNGMKNRQTLCFRCNCNKGSTREKGGRMKKNDISSLNPATHDASTE